MKVSDPGHHKQSAALAEVCQRDGRNGAHRKKIQRV